MVQTPLPTPSPRTTVAPGHTDVERDRTRVGAHGTHARRTRHIARMGKCASKSHAGAVASDAMAGPHVGLRGEWKQVRAGLAAYARGFLG